MRESRAKPGGPHDAVDLVLPAPGDHAPHAQEVGDHRLVAPGRGTLDRRDHLGSDLGAVAAGEFVLHDARDLDLGKGIDRAPG